MATMCWYATINDTIEILVAETDAERMIFQFELVEKNFNKYYPPNDNTKTH